MKFKEVLETVLTEEISTYLKTDSYIFAIFGDEGNNPHIHYYIGDSPLSTEGSGCVALEYNGSANHGKHKYPLNKKAKFVIETWLAIQKNWEKVCSDWNATESNKKKIDFKGKLSPYYIKELNVDSSETVKYFDSNEKIDFNILRLKVRKDLKNIESKTLDY